MPGVIATEAASDTCQSSVDDPPGVTIGGLAEKFIIDGKPGPEGMPPGYPLTDTDVVAVVLAVPLLAVRV